MDDKQTRLEKWAMELQAGDDRSAKACAEWFHKTQEQHDDDAVMKDVVAAAWKESRRQTMLEFAPRILIASEVAALIHKLDALQPKQ